MLHCVGRGSDDIIIFKLITNQVAQQLDKLLIGVAKFNQIYRIVFDFKKTSSFLLEKHQCVQITGILNLRIKIFFLQVKAYLRHGHITSNYLPIYPLKEWPDFWKAEFYGPPENVSETLNNLIYFPILNYNWVYNFLENLLSFLCHQPKI